MVRAAVLQFRGEVGRGKIVNSGASPSGYGPLVQRTSIQAVVRDRGSRFRDLILLLRTSI